MKHSIKYESNDGLKATASEKAISEDNKVKLLQLAVHMADNDYAYHEDDKLYYHTKHEDCVQLLYNRLLTMF